MEGRHPRLGPRLNELGQVVFLGEHENGVKVLLGRWVGCVAEEIKPGVDNGEQDLSRNGIILGQVDDPGAAVGRLGFEKATVEHALEHHARAGEGSRADGTVCFAGVLADHEGEITVGIEGYGVHHFLWILDDVVLRRG